MGVAAVSYVACGGSDTSDPAPKDAGSDASTNDVVANLVAPPDTGNQNDVVANLVAPPDTGADQTDDQPNLNDVVANLVAPPDASGD